MADETGMKRFIDDSKEGGKSYLMPSNISCFCHGELQMFTRFFSDFEDS